jgi:thioredoxin 1
MSFTELINSEKPVLVDFSAEWCGPCKMMAPVLKDIAHKYEGRLNVIKVDVDNNASAAQAYNISSVPTLMIFRNGKVLWRQSGAMSLNAMEKIIDQYI